MHKAQFNKDISNQYNTIQDISKDHAHTENGQGHIYWRYLTSYRTKEISKLSSNSHVREGDTCSIKIEASKDDVSQTTSPHTNGKPGTNGLKGREKQRQTIQK